MNKFASVLLLLFLHIECNAQMVYDVLMRYAGNIQQFNQEFPQEKVFLQFDNTGYFQGETIWFKAFVVNASGLTRPRSTVLYVDLLSPNGTLLEQKKLKIVAGQADGCFSLMDGSTEQARELRGVLPYPSGYYEIRAYTQYMMNFKEHLEYSRVLPVFKAPVAKGMYTNPMIADLSESELIGIRPKGERADFVNLDFFPEGGSTISGTVQRVAFKATDENGFPISGVLRVYNNDKDNVVEAETFHDGMGCVSVFYGRKNIKADFIYEGETYKVDMPKPQQKGFSIRTEKESDCLNVTIFKGHVNKPDHMGISVISRGNLIGFKSFDMEDDSIKIAFNTIDWPVGVCQVNLFNVAGTTLASRHFFNYGSGFLMPELTASFNNDPIQPYSPIKIAFDLRNGFGESFKDRFCISVRDASQSLTTMYSDDLATSLLLSSDLKGLINNPHYYFESNDEEHQRAMDLLMMIQGWERYDWNDMSGNSAFEETHRMEDSLSVNGWISGFWNKNKMLDNVNVYVSIAPLDNDSVLEVGKYTTEDNGYFGFNTKDFYNKADLVILLENHGQFAEHTGANLILQRSMLPEVLPYEMVDTILVPTCYHPQSITETVGNDEIIVTDGIMIPEVEVAARKYVDYFTFKAYDVDEYVETTLDFGEWPTDLMGYFLDLGYTVTPYGDGILDSHFYTVEENYGKERFAFVGSGYLDSHPIFWYIHDSKGIVYPDDFRFGNRCWDIDTEDVLSVLVFDDPASLTEISESVPLYMETVRKKQNVAVDGAMNGLLSTKKYLLVDVLIKEGYKLKTRQEKRNHGKRITTLRGFNYPVQFYSPEYPDGPVEGTEDYRRTLYWNPNVITDSLGHAQIEFYNNSYSTRFNVSGAGITAGGSPYVLDMDF